VPFLFMSANTQVECKSLGSPVALGFGANLGEAEETFQQAVTMLRAGGLKNIRQASVYKSKAQDCYPGTPDFSNSALTGCWLGSPQELLELTQSIEVKLGRPREHDSKASRSIDIDLLLFAQCIIDEPQLQVPHPRMCRRHFVMQPLAEIAPSWLMPDSGKSIAQCLAELQRRDAP
jgi:2-amino-4-hydroxy-6-hydroxymethyldihydropteridine diphosphokinase